MKAIVYTKYGSPDVLQLKEVEKPEPKDNEVLIKIYATSLNASDVEFLTASPSYVRMWGLLKPKYNILGSDIAGKVEAIGKNVTLFQVGDDVYGDVMYRWGGLAEYVCAPEKSLMLKPSNLSFEDAASIPQAAVVALQSLNYNEPLKKGQKVLIIGAGGSTGSFAIQIAKAYGAEVTGVDNTEKLEMMRSLGADHVIDYTKENFTKNGKQYDLIVGLVTPHSIFDYKRSLNSKGAFVMTGGFVPKLLQTLIFGSLISVFSNKKMGILMHEQNKKDLGIINKLYNDGKLVPVIDKKYSLKDAAKAFQSLIDGKAKGKVVILQT